MMVTKLKLAAVALAVGLVAVCGAGTASYRAFAEQPPRVSEPPPATPAEARVKRLKKQMSDLAEELRRAEEAAARERALPPQKTPVAVIFGDVPITRDELADHLLSRLSARQLEGYVNRRILEHACKKEGVVVTDAEVDAWLKAEMAKTNLTEKAFRARLREQNKTLREWKEDVARTRLMLEKLAGRMRVSEEDLRRAYEARYGEKVECQLLAWHPGQRGDAERAAGLLRRGKATFEELAAKQQPQGPRCVTIERRATADCAALEEAVFALEPGEVTPVLKISNAFVVLKCVRRVPADSATRYEDVRESLRCELMKRLQQRDTTKLFEELKARARAKLLWTPPEDNERSER